MHHTIKVSDLKPRQKYYLTYDFYPYGGTEVNFVKWVRAKDLWEGAKRDAALLRSKSGVEFFVSRSAWLFTCPPEV